MEVKTCCVTGHRTIPADKGGYVAEELLKAIMAAYNDGYRRFISGVAEGVDLKFAEIVVTMKNVKPSVILEAAIPYAGRTKAKDPMLQAVLAACDNKTVISEKSTRGCYLARDRYMVDQSSRVIAVYDGRTSGGTFYTMNYAKEQGREVCVIEI